MAVDFLKYFKSELDPEMAEFLQQQLDAEEAGEAEYPPPPPRAPSPDNPERRARKARTGEALAFQLRGQELVVRGDYVAGAKEYEKSIAILVGEGFQVPLRHEDGPYISQKYLELDEVERSMLMSSCAILGAAILKASTGATSGDTVRVSAEPL